MNIEERAAADRDLIYLIGCALQGTKPDAGRIERMNLERVYEIARRHMLETLAGMALESAGVRTARFSHAVAMGMRRAAMLDAEQRAVVRELASAGIWHVPLKGAVLKDFYPKFGMRQMSDIDILVDAGRAGDIRTVMERLGYETVRFGSRHHDIYKKPHGIAFEMHVALFNPETRPREYAHYQHVKQRLVRDEGGDFSFRFSPEDLYVYITTHANKHYTYRGTGLRSLVDTYVFLKRYADGLDWAYVEREAESLGIADFERGSRSLAVKLFDGETLSAADAEMLAYIIDSGVYGTKEHGTINQINRLSGRGERLRYILRRVFLPMESVKKHYPFFYRHKFLLPALTVWRIGKGVTTRRGFVKSMLKTLSKRENP